MAKTVYLSTTDNPFNPATDFDHWLAYDLEKGYGSCELLARVALIDDEASDEEYQEAIEAAIDEILKWDELGIRCKVVA